MIILHIILCMEFILSLLLYDLFFVLYSFKINLVPDIYSVSYMIGQ